jgi:NDP-sugar pyrophosphorylase family protein
VLSVNYKKEIIKDYFQDGRYHGVNISYIIEEKRLGTAGALSLLYDHPKHPFIVMNGDLLTKINYNNLLEFHLKNNSLGTMCIREYEYQIPYGVIETNNHRILSIEEKPIHRYFANAGVYVLNPEVINYIPNDSFFDMPDLFKKLLSDKKGVTAFPLREYWMDIGKMEEFKKANDDFFRIFV